MTSTAANPAVELLTLEFQIYPATRDVASTLARLCVWTGVQTFKDVLKQVEDTAQSVFACYKDNGTRWKELTAIYQEHIFALAAEVLEIPKYELFAASDALATFFLDTKAPSPEKAPPAPVAPAAVIEEAKVSEEPAPLPPPVANYGSFLEALTAPTKPTTLET